MARADRRRVQRAGAHARGGHGTGARPRVAQDDTLFFSRIRNHAKWVFVLLAIVFASSFVLFGVGTGFGGLQDILLQERATGGGPSENDSRDEIKEQPEQPAGLSRPRDRAPEQRQVGRVDRAAREVRRAEAERHRRAARARRALPPPGGHVPHAGDRGAGRAPARRPGLDLPAVVVVEDRARRSEPTRSPRRSRRRTTPRSTTPSRR